MDMRTFAGFTIAACVAPGLALAQPSSHRPIETRSHRALNTQLGPDGAVRMPSSIPPNLLSSEMVRRLLRSEQTRGNTPSSPPSEVPGANQDAAPRGFGNGDAAQGFRNWLQRQGIWPTDVDEALPQLDRLKSDSSRSPAVSNSGLTGGGNPPDDLEEAADDSQRAPTDSRRSDLEQTVRRWLSRSGNQPNGPTTRMLPTTELLRQLESMYDSDTGRKLFRDLASGPLTPPDRNTSRTNGNRATSEGQASATTPRSTQQPRPGRDQSAAPPARSTAQASPRIQSSSAPSASSGLSRRLLESLIEAIDSTGTELVKAARDSDRQQSWAWLSKREKELSRWITKRRQERPWQSAVVVNRPSPRPPAPKSDWNLPGFPSSMPKTGVVLVVLAVGCTAVFFLWGRFAIPKPGIEKTALPVAVSPSAVIDRQTLIDACHRLAVRRLGWQTKFWNHIRLFGRLASESPERRLELADLSRIYEHARYAPREFALTSEQLQRARTILASLEGREVAVV